MLGNEYKEYCKKFNAVWKYISSCSKDLDTIVGEVCEKRLYFDEEDRWKSILSEVGVAFVSNDICDYSRFSGDEFKDLALFSEDGYFLLNERYIIPVRDMLGNIIALIGWYPDSKKYITTPSRFLSKDCLFFGLEQLSKTGLGKDYFIVEGIFDSLHLRAMGYNAVACMGISVSRVKELLCGLFRKVVAVPDNDSQGRRVVKNDLWKLPRNGSYLRWVGSLDMGDTEESITIKDIDRFCSLFEEDDIKEVFNSCFNSKERIIKLNI